MSGQKCQTHIVGVGVRGFSSQRLGHGLVGWDSGGY